MEMTREDCKAFVLASCERMPEIGSYFKIPWDAYKRVWVVRGLTKTAVELAMRWSDGRIETFEIPDATWIAHIKNGLIWRSSKDEV